MQMSCSCGRKLRVGDDQAGQRVKCPSCGKRILVPGTATEAGTSATAMSPIRSSEKSANSSSEIIPKTPLPKRIEDKSASAALPESAAAPGPAEAGKSASTPRRRTRIRVPDESSPQQLSGSTKSPAGAVTGFLILGVIGGGIWWFIAGRDGARESALKSEDTRPTGGVAGLQNVSRVAYSTDGKRLAVAIRSAGSREGSANTQIWDIAEDKLIVKAAGHAASVSQIAMSPDGVTFATSSGILNEIILRDGNGRSIRELVEPRASPALGEELLAFSPDGKSLLSIMTKFVVRMEVETPITDKQPFPIGPGTKAAASPIAPIIAIALVYPERPPRPTVELYDYETKQSKPIALAQAATAVAISYDGSTLAVATLDGAIQVIDIKTQTIRAVLPKPKDAKHPHYKRIAIDGDGSRICGLPLGGSNAELWDVGTRLHRILGFGGCADVALSPDGKTIALAMSEGPIHFLDSLSGQERTP